MAVSRYREYVSAFNAVMDRYEEARVLNVHTTSEGFYFNLSREGTSSGHASRVVKPSLSDFIADVELTAKRVLDPPMYDFFKATFVDHYEVAAVVTQTAGYRSALSRVKRKVGRAFIASKIFPLTIYFTAKDLR